MTFNNIKNVINNKAKLKWACRRGMLELDLLLEKFLKEAYDDLSEHDKNLFVQLLNYSDPELFAWLINRDMPADREMVSLIERIQHCARPPL